MKQFSIIIFSFLLISCVKTDSADLIIHNATVYSMDELNSKYQAIAIKNGKILDIGPEHYIMNKYLAKTYFDALKHYVYPAFIDPHNYFIAYAKNLGVNNLDNIQTKSELFKRLQKLSKKNTLGLKLYGLNTNLAYKERNSISQYINTHFHFPILIKLESGFDVIINDKGLIKFGLVNNRETNYSDSLITSCIVNPIISGKLALELSNNFDSQFTEELNHNQLKNAIDTSFKYGIGSIHCLATDIKDYEMFNSIQLDSNSNLLDLTFSLDYSPDAIDYLNQSQSNNLGGIDYFIDGGYQTNSALTFELNSNGNHGDLYINLDSVKKELIRLSKDSIQVIAHCFGDSAIHLIGNLFHSQNPEFNNLRWRIENAQSISEKSFDPIRNSSILINVTPQQYYSDSFWLKGKPILSKKMYRYKTMQKINGFISAGSSNPIESINPLKTFYSLIESRNPNKLTSIEALKSITTFASIPMFLENKSGSIEKGKNADIIIINRDLLNNPKTFDKKVFVSHTYLKGKLVYKR